MARQLAEWTTTFSPDAYQQYFKHDDAKQAGDAYSARIRDMQTDYHTRPFVHAVSSSCDSRCSQLSTDGSVAGLDAKGLARHWLGRVASSVPTCNRECSTAAAHAQQAFGIDPVHDGLRVMFIKAFKVASTSSSSVFYRLALSHDMVALHSHPAPNTTHVEWPYQMLAIHSFFHNDKQSTYANRHCGIVPLDGVQNRNISWCGGYQPYVVSNALVQITQCHTMQMV